MSTRTFLALRTEPCDEQGNYPGSPATVLVFRSVKARDAAVAASAAEAHEATRRCILAYEVSRANGEATMDCLSAYADIAPNITPTTERHVRYLERFNYARFPREEA